MGVRGVGGGAGVGVRRGGVRRECAGVEPGGGTLKGVRRGGAVKNLKRSETKVEQSEKPFLK